MLKVDMAPRLTADFVAEASHRRDEFARRYDREFGHNATSTNRSFPGWFIIDTPSSAIHSR